MTVTGEACGTSPAGTLLLGATDTARAPHMPWTTAARKSPGSLRTTILVLLLQTKAAAAAAACPVAFAAGACGPKSTCYDFPHIRQMAGGPFQVKNSNAVPEAVQYIVASPCQNRRPGCRSAPAAVLSEQHLSLHRERAGFSVWSRLQLCCRRSNRIRLPNWKRATF